MFHLKCSFISSLSILISSLIYNNEVKLVIEIGARFVNILKPQPYGERVPVVFPEGVSICL